MAFFDAENRFTCAAASVIASIIVGIITAFLTITAVIAVTPVFLWVLFGIAVAYLAVTLIAVALTRRSAQCDDSSLSVVLTGILGTVLTAVILLGIPFAATSIVGAIITGTLLGSFSLTVTGTACLVKCLAEE